MNNLLYKIRVIIFREVLFYKQKAYFFIFNKHSHSYATTNISSNSDNIKNIISSYFNSYSNSLQILEAPNYDNIIVENNNTRLYSAMNELQVEQNKLSNLSYQNVKDELINEAKDTIKYLSGDKDADNSENN